MRRAIDERLERGEQIGRGIEEFELRHMDVTELLVDTGIGGLMVAAGLRQRDDAHAHVEERELRERGGAPPRDGDIRPLIEREELFGRHELHRTDSGSLERVSVVFVADAEKHRDVESRSELRQGQEPVKYTARSLAAALYEQARGTRGVIVFFLVGSLEKDGRQHLPHHLGRDGRKKSPRLLESKKNHPGEFCHDTIGEARYSVGLV